MVELRDCGGTCFKQSFAGDAFNTAVYLKRSAPAIDVEFCTATGENPLSQDMKESWAEEGIGSSLAFTVAAHTPGLYLIETDDAGDRKFHYWRKNSAARFWWRLLLAHGVQAALTHADLVYFSGITLAILPHAERMSFLSALRDLPATGVKIAFDPNFRPALWDSLDEARTVMEAALSVSNIVLPSSQDLDMLYMPASAEAHIERLVSLGADEIALTSDKAGCWVRAGTIRHLLPERVVIARDTSGAGDAFNGAYLAARLNGRDAVGAAKAGLGLAGQVVMHPGAIIDKHSM